MDPRAREGLLDRCVGYHGHLCLGQVLGVRLALKGMELIGTDDPMRMIVFIENDRCIADAIQVVTGTRIGRRSAKLVDYGKMAATFLRVGDGDSHRVNVRHVDPGLRHDKEALRRSLHVPDSDLLAWQAVRVSLRPEELPGRPRRTVHCVRCAERVFDGKDVPAEEGPLCLSCAHGAYYEIPEAGS